MAAFPVLHSVCAHSVFAVSLCRAQAVINTMCGFGVQTQKFLEANKFVYAVGCADRAVKWIESHLLLVGALALGLALPQVPKYMCDVGLLHKTQANIHVCFEKESNYFFLYFPS